MSKRIHSSSPSTDREPKQSKTAPHEEATHILDMNDDCFEAVFSHLRAEDLCVVKRVCQRFEAVADDHFQRKYRNVAFVFAPQEEEEEFSLRSEFNLSQNMLQLFGKFLLKLKVYGIRHNGAHHWRKILRYCKQLKELMIIECDLSYFKPNVLSEIKLGLINLELHDCFPENRYKKVIRYFNKVQQLAVNYVYGGAYFGYGGEFLRHEYPQLKEVEFTLSSFMKENFVKFTRKNPQIETMFVNSDSNILDCIDLDVIAVNCKSLRELDVRGLQPPMTSNDIANLASLTRMGKLQYLSMNRCNYNMTTTIDGLAAQNSLVYLNLAVGEMDETFCGALSKLTNLKELTLSKFGGLNADFLKTLMGALNLENFEIISCDGVKFGDVAVAIKYAPTLKTIKFTARGKKEFLDEERFLQLAKARKDAGARSPLTFIQIEHQFKQNSVDIQIIEANVDFIRLKKTDIHRFWIDSWISSFSPDDGFYQIQYDNDTSDEDADDDESDDDEFDEFDDEFDDESDDEFDDDFDSEDEDIIP